MRSSGDRMFLGERVDLLDDVSLKPQGLGGKAGYVTPITANHAASDKMGYSA